MFINLNEKINYVGDDKSYTGEKTLRFRYKNKFFYLKKTVENTIYIETSGCDISTKAEIIIKLFTENELFKKYAKLTENENYKVNIDGVCFAEEDTKDEIKKKLIKSLGCLV